MSTTLHPGCAPGVVAMVHLFGCSADPDIGSAEALRRVQAAIVATGAPYGRLDMSEPVRRGALVDMSGATVPFPDGPAYDRCYVALADPSPELGWGYAATWIFVPVDGEAEADAVVADTNFPAHALSHVRFYPTGHRPMMPMLPSESRETSARRATPMTTDTRPALEFILPRRDLARLVDACKGAADAKSTMPSLAHVLLEAKGSKLRVVATDLYVSCSGTTAADVATEGSVSLNAKDLAERLHNMPEGPIHVIATAGSIATTIKAVGAPRRYTIHGLPGDQFPKTTVCSPDAFIFDLAVDVVARLIRQVIPAISTDETRPHVNSTLFTWGGGVARMVATDGHRLAIATSVAPLPGDAVVPVTRWGQDAPEKRGFEVLINLDTCKELRRLCDVAMATKSESGARVEVRVHGPTVFFELGGLIFSAKVIDAQFPPYQQVTPTMTRFPLRTSRLALLEAIDAVSVATGTGSSAGSVKLALRKNALHLSAASAESGDGHDELAADYAGEDILIGANATYLKHALDAIEADEVLLGITGELDPIRIEAAEPDEAATFVGIVMPTRVS